jgi:hypothetical protein
MSDFIGESSWARKFFDRGIGLGVDGTDDSDSTPTFETNLSFHLRDFSEGENDKYSSFPFLHVEEVDTYFLVGFNEDSGVSAGARGHGFAGVGWQFLRAGSTGADLYTMVVIGSQIEGHNNRIHSDNMSYNTGVEIGLINGNGDSVFMLAPTVMYGMVAYSVPNDDKIVSDSWLQIGGRMRVVVDDKLYASAEVLSNPSDPSQPNFESGTFYSDSLQFRVSGDYHLPEGQWTLNANAQLVSYGNADGLDEAQFQDFSLGVAVIREF